MKKEKILTYMNGITATSLEHQSQFIRAERALSKVKSRNEYDYLAFGPYLKDRYTGGAEPLETFVIDDTEYIVLPTQSFNMSGSMGRGRKIVFQPVKA